MRTKVVYNACFGGFSLSKKAALRLSELGVSEMTEQLKSNESRPGIFGDSFHTDLPRHDSRLVRVIEDLGEEANGPFADLQITKLSGNRYRIDEYDGSEGVQEPDDIDWIVVK